MLKIILGVGVLIGTAIAIWLSWGNPNAATTFFILFAAIELIIAFWGHLGKTSPANDERLPIQDVDSGDASTEKIRGAGIQVAETHAVVESEPDEKRVNQEGPPVFFPDIDSTLVSRFADSEQELQTVLALRQACFSESTVSSDASYRQCWHKNPDCFKVVYAFERITYNPIGYWGLIPIDESAYHTFLKGKLSHEEILTGEAIDWCDVDPDNVYVYVIGAVVPAIVDAQSWLYKRMSGWILIDMLDFAVMLSSLVKLRGVCGYPSRPEGREQFSRLRFKQSGIYIDDNEEQPVSFVPEDGIERLIKEIQLKSEQFGHPVHWEDRDQQRFLLRLNTCTA